ncbi:MAG: hypothetical protein HOI49_10375 [Bacteroidetes bacterium]|jgi:nucleoid DNA-binding protein|nr:hypothetical protein [Bacteroidota bacterium]
MDLTKEISFLLYKHNCVILPKFGAFLLHEKEAEINSVANYCTPKQKTVTFNKQITNNDGLLANRVSTLNQSAYEQGLKMVETYVTNLWATLRDKRNCELKGIGTFYYTKEAKVVFVPHHAVNFESASYGLPKLRLTTLPRGTEVVIPETSISTPEPKVEKLVAQKEVARTKTKRKNAAVQQKKLDKNTATKKQKSRISAIGMANAFCVVLLVGLCISIFQYESNPSYFAQGDEQTASVLDIPSVNTTASIPSGYGVYAEVSNTKEAIQFTQKIRTHYEEACILQTENNTRVFIIAFDNPEVAKEYKVLLQNKLDQKLVIKQK